MYEPSNRQTTEKSASPVHRAVEVWLHSHVEITYRASEDLRQIVCQPCPSPETLYTALNINSHPTVERSHTSGTACGHGRSSFDVPYDLKNHLLVPSL